MTDPSPSEASSPALKEIFNPARLRHIAEELAAVAPDVDAERFLEAGLQGLEDMSVMERMRHAARSLRPVLPPDNRASLEILRRLAPRLNHPFAAMVASEYVALYGLDDFEASMETLRFLTPFGSSEFAVRPFLRRDLHRALRTMEEWAGDENEHVRRLASEGARPRLPWSFRLEALRDDPSPLAPLLDRLKADPSLYVRRSVANNLNDVSKDHPDWALDKIESWPLEDARTAWIARHALRGLIKKGDGRALVIIGADAAAEVTLSDLTVTPRRVRIGGEIDVAFTLRSVSDRSQRLIVDYAVRYVKKSGRTSAKTFKLKILTLGPHAEERVRKRHSMRDLSTRVHYPGEHAVEIRVSGRTLGETAFELVE
jgi:3-methyladenine DNA glycosylase AlkC